MQEIFTILKKNLKMQNQMDTILQNAANYNLHELYRNHLITYYYDYIIPQKTTIRLVGKPR